MRVPPARAPRDVLTAGVFTPGTVLAGRYRVIALLGRGGMGEVYRADDLKLGMAVALKFLPRALAADPSRYQRFLAEIRLSRQVSHPNVCRVHDIADIDGMPVLSMEYIDGEDLASLLKRIGRLPADKALDIARQIAAGLAAAHNRGVLHRDLKPANIMLDGRGGVRITDFGLAVAVDAGPRENDVSGTPAYMAPEQFTGGGASVRSDIYGLGLVLYELYTGRTAFSAPSLDALIDRKRHDTPALPSTLVTDMDPSVERVIVSSIASDPQARPASVAHVAAALPGGSLLEAALLAGQTPSPELVAAMGTNTGLSPSMAWGLVALLIAGSVAALSLGDRFLLWRGGALERSPDALAERARDVLTALGHPRDLAYRASGFETDVEYLRDIRNRDHSRARWNEPSPGFFRFWYRESPQPLESWRFVMRYGNFSRVDPVDPPLDVAGMTRLKLDPSGTARGSDGRPATGSRSRRADGTPDWRALLTAGGYDPAAWRSVAPGRTPPFYADARAAWEGTWPLRTDLPVRLEAAALRGRPVYFEAIFPWSTPARTSAALLNAAERATIVFFVVTAAALIAVAAVLASRNVRAGRGDRRGAVRLSTFILGCMFVAWVFGETHVAALGEATLLAMALSWALLVAGCCWLGYLAAEPFVRRQWPHMLVAWTRAARRTRPRSAGRPRRPHRLRGGRRHRGARSHRTRRTHAVRPRAGRGTCRHHRRRVWRAACRAAPAVASRAERLHGAQRRVRAGRPPCRPRPPRIGDRGVCRGCRARVLRVEWRLLDDARLESCRQRLLRADSGASRTSGLCRDVLRGRAVHRLSGHRAVVTLVRRRRRERAPRTRRAGRIWICDRRAHQADRRLTADGNTYCSRSTSARVSVLARSRPRARAVNGLMPYMHQGKPALLCSWERAAGIRAAVSIAAHGAAGRACHTGRRGAPHSSSIGIRARSGGLTRAASGECSRALERPASDSRRRVCRRSRGSGAAIVRALRRGLQRLDPRPGCGGGAVAGDWPRRLRLHSLLGQPGRVLGGVARQGSVALLVDDRRGRACHGHARLLQQARTVPEAPQSRLVWPRITVAAISGARQMRCRSNASWRIRN